MKKRDTFYLVFLFLLIVLAMLLSSCKTKYVTVPEYHSVFVEKHDTLLKTDSIYERDSVYVTTKGDTILEYKTKYLYRDRWRERIIYKDSLRSDTIRVPYPVEKKLSFWDKTWLNTGKTLSVVFVLVMCVFIVKKWLQARSKC